MAVEVLTAEVLRGHYLLSFLVYLKQIHVASRPFPSNN